MVNDPLDIENGLNRERLQRGLEAAALGGVSESEISDLGSQIAALDHAVLNRSRARFAGIEAGVKDRLRLRRASRFATAAGLLLAALIAIYSGQRPGPESLIAGDLNGDNRVDVIDAYGLARAIENHHADAFDPRFDFSDDARVDASDVTLLLDRIVSLNTTRRGG